LDRPYVYKLVQLMSIHLRKQLCNFGKYLKDAFLLKQCPSSINIYLYCNDILYTCIIVEMVFFLYMYIVAMPMSRSVYS